MLFETDDEPNTAVKKFIILPPYYPHTPHPTHPDPQVGIVAIRVMGSGPGQILEGGGQIAQAGGGGEFERAPPPLGAPPPDWRGA